MFTGIVEEVGRVRRIDHATVSQATAGQTTDAVLEVEGPLVTSDAALGDSIAVNGVCLTVARLTEEGFVADVMPETLRRTSLGALRPGSPVNLERAMAVNGRLGGHLVQGHVDGVARLVSHTPGPRWDEVTFSLPDGLARYIAVKGSIAVSGVSLTVSEVGPEAFGVSLIPTTLSTTILGELSTGDPVNIEVDVIAKYVERLLLGADR